MSKREDIKLAKAIDSVIEALGDRGVNLKGITVNKPITFEGKSIKEFKTFSWDRLRNPRIKIIVKSRGGSENE